MRGDRDSRGGPVIEYGGEHHTMVSPTYADLLRITGGEEAAVA